jgi:hypothetical protein
MQFVELKTLHLCDKEKLFDILGIFAYSRPTIMLRIEYRLRVLTKIFMSKMGEVMEGVNTIAIRPAALFALLVKHYSGDEKTGEHVVIYNTVLVGKPEGKN